MKISRTYTSLNIYLTDEERLLFGDRLLAYPTFRDDLWLILLSSSAGVKIGRLNDKMWVAQIYKPWIYSVPHFLSEWVKTEVHGPHLWVAKPTMERKMSKEVLKLLDPRYKELKNA